MGDYRTKEGFDVDNQKETSQKSFDAEAFFAGLDLQTGLQIKDAIANQKHFEIQDLDFLGNLVRRALPSRTLEIGLASGSSALTILGAASKTLDEHIAIDPYQHNSFGDKGVFRINNTAHAGKFRLIERLSYIALPELLASGFKCDFAFIDASHMFDHTMLEFFYIDKMLRIGGRICFDDSPWPMVGTVINFIEANIPAYEVDRSSGRFAVLQKLREDARRWYDFRPFEVPRNEVLEMRMLDYRAKFGTDYK